MGSEVTSCMRFYKPRVGSLAFPIGIIVYSAYKLFRCWQNGRGLGSIFFSSWVFVAAIVLGGIIPIILTFALKIETHEYFLPRLIIFICTIAVMSISEEFVGVSRSSRVIIMMIASVMTLIYFHKFRSTRFSEWCVICISTPTIYMMVYYILIVGDVERYMTYFKDYFS